jgi:hypothetical protein
LDANDFALPRYQQSEAGDVPLLHFALDVLVDRSVSGALRPERTGKAQSESQQ